MEPHGRWNRERLGQMGARIIEQHQMQVVGIGGLDIIDKGLKMGRLEMGEGAKVTTARERIGRPVEPEGGALMLVPPHRLDAAQRDPAPQLGTQAEATFIHQPQAHRRRELFQREAQVA